MKNKYDASFSSVLIIGAGGQTGQLFIRSIAQVLRHVRLEAFVRSDQVEKFSKIFPGEVILTSNLKNSLRNRPDLIILATPNPVDEILESIAPDIKSPVTLILPQNGVEVAQKAINIFKKSEVKLVRASLFTTINLDKNGLANFDPTKKRITLAPIETKGQELFKVKSLFETAGFEVKLFDDYRSMEWTKLITNLLGSTATITGLTPRETFSDEELIELEFKALKERFEIMHAAGIKFADIPWQKISILPRVIYLPSPVLKIFRSRISEMIAAGRNNQPPAAYRKLMEGRPTEVKFYHQPFVDLGLLHGLRSIADETVLEIISEHENGRINLSTIPNEKKKDILFKTGDILLQKPLIPRNPIITSIVEKLIDFFCKNLTVTGKENFDEIRQSLNSGKSVILLANHSSHADHPLIVKAFRQNGYPDLAERIIFIAGMKVKNEFLGRRFNDAYAHIIVSTPSSDALSEEENRQAQLINLKGFTKINKLLNKGNLIVLYAEGTRSRDSKLHKAIPSVARYFENPNIQYLVPVGIQGSSELLPVGKTIPSFADAKVAFGEPVSSQDVINSVIKYLPMNMKNLDKRDKNVRAKINELIIDHIMKKIAKLLPVEQRGFYA